MRKIVCAVFALILFILPAMAEQNIPDQSIIPAGFESIEMVDGEINEFSREMTLNAKTEFEYTFIGYFLPAGSYKVTNLGAYPSQVTIYINEKQKVDGWEEFKIPEDKRPLLVFAGESGELALAAGEFVKLADGDSVLFELTKVE